jgi:hypothetical protein
MAAHEDRLTLDEERAFARERWLAWETPGGPPGGWSPRMADEAARRVERRATARERGLQGLFLGAPRDGWILATGGIDRALGQIAAIMDLSDGISLHWLNQRASEPDSGIAEVRRILNPHLPTGEGGPLRPWLAIRVEMPDNAPAPAAPKGHRLSAVQRKTRARDGTWWRPGDDPPEAAFEAPQQPLIDR